MCKQKVLIFILLCLFCAGSKLYSQITANFTQGCSPFNVHFTGPANATSPSWNFGAGGTNGSGLNADNIYYTTGSYVVTYTAIVNSAPVNYTLQIVVLPLPSGTINYVLPPSHCKPMTVTFTGVGAPGSTYGWVFGDQLSGAGSPISHAYNSGGAFTPTMVITDATGCTNTITSAVINVSSPPSVAVLANPALSSCEDPFTIIFTANAASGSPLGQNLTYNWAFGNGTPPSTVSNPPAVTFNAGSFLVNLTVKDDNQCSITVPKQVTVQQPSVTATIPATVCINSAVPVTVASSPLTNHWQRGDGGTEDFALTALNVPLTTTIQPYTSPGSKTIVITATAGSCVATFTKTIFVERITPQFTATAPTSSCGPAMIGSYINQSTVNTNAPLNYTWVPTWGPSTAPAAYNHAIPLISNATSPTFTFYQGTQNPYTIYELFKVIMTITVQSTSMAQCTATFSNIYDSITRPTAWFNKNKSQGCAPLTVNYRDSSFTGFGNPITSYVWNDGGGNTFAGTISPPGSPIPAHAFTYTSAGTYTPFLTITTAYGCNDISFIDTVRVSDQPTVSITFTPNLSVCAGQPVQINMTALPSPTVIQHWHIDSDGGFFSGCTTNPNPVYAFTHPGVQTFTVSGYQNGCLGTSVSSQTITVKGPVAKVRAETNCTSPLSVKFTSYLQDVQTATLSFGDNTSSIITGNAPGNLTSIITHTYLNTGDYTITLKSQNTANICSYTHTTAIQVRSIHADIAVSVPVPTTIATAMACVDQNITFDASGSTGVNVGCNRGYIWSVVSANTPSNTTRPVDTDASSIVKQFNPAGIYTLTLLVKDINGCTSTDTKRFRISDANPSFTFDINPVCSSNTLHLINTTATTAANPDPITGFYWNFGDGATLSTTSTTPVAHQYQNAASPFTLYNVVLSATNTAGCKKEVPHVLRVNKPDAGFNFQPHRLIACIPEKFIFSASPAYATYTMTYGDSLAPLTTTANGRFAHKYTTSGDFKVNLTVTDSAGCMNTSTLSIMARGTPVASFTTVGNANICINDTIRFISTSTSSDNSPITGFTWDLGSGPVLSTNSIVTGFYLTPGLQYVSLIASTASGFCASKATHTIYVYGTDAQLQLNKTKFCIGDEIIATLTGTIVDAQDWICNVGFGIQASPLPVIPSLPLAHTYTSSTETGTVSITAIIYSPNHSCSIYRTKDIEIYKLNPDFKRNFELTLPDSAHCVKIPDNFTHSINNTTTSLAYSWDFGNGSTTTAENPVYIFPDAGIWPVHYSVSVPEVGCTVSSTKNMTISPQPTVTINAGDNCPGSEFVIQVNGSQGITSGTWAPAENLISPPAFSIAATYPLSAFTATAKAATSTSFSLTVTDYIGCASEVAVKQISIQQPASTLNLDTTIVIGETVPINLYAGTNYLYNWTPVTTDLSCIDCYNPVSTSTVNITYTVIISDMLGCSAVANTYKIIIEPRTTVDVPSAFTPNGDGVNDIVYVDGWGIKQLNYFRIYNRWGQLLFESTDVKYGWNGYFNGIPQNMETYVYQVSALPYLADKPVLKTGTIKLIR